MGENKIYGVALGPGDPELITVKALKCLQNSDVIYYPGSFSSNGEKTSFSRNILDNLDLDVDKLRGIFLEMKPDRIHAENIYDDCYNEMISQYKEGKNISFVSEGDISFFSTFSYFIEKLKQDSVNFEMIPGIPAFIMAGSRVKTPLVLQRDNLKVLPAPSSKDEVLEAIENNDTVVVMKLSTLRNNLISLLEELENRFIYCEKLGTDDEFICQNVNELRERKIPYFSLLLVNKYIK